MMQIQVFWITYRRLVVTDVSEDSNVYILEAQEVFSLSVKPYVIHMTG